MESAITLQPRKGSNNSVGPQPLTTVSNDSVQGLDLLATIDQVIIVQKPELVDPAEQEEGHQSYRVLDGAGNKLYWASEINRADACCGNAPQRPFEIALIDAQRRLVLRLTRPCSPCLFCSASWQFCCCWCGRLGGSMEIALADGRVLGKVVHRFVPCYMPYYNIEDASGNVVFRLRGDCCSDCCCCQSHKFRIRNRGGSKIGSIRRDWQDERISLLVSDADKLFAKMDKDLSVEHKALIMASVFLLDFMYFESTTRSHTRTQVKNTRPRLAPLLTKGQHEWAE